MKLSVGLALVLLWVSSVVHAEDYRILYDVTVNPDSGWARVDIHLEGEQLPAEIRLRMDPQRYRNPGSAQPLKVGDNQVVWQPQAPQSRLSYDFVIDGTRSNGRFDSRITDSWAILRSDKLIPAVATSTEGLQSSARIRFNMPKDWLAVAPYDQYRAKDRQLRHEHEYTLIDPGRYFVRPKGWLALGELGVRQDNFAGTDVRVIAPREEGLHRQDTLSFIGWTLPELKKVFPDFPSRLVIVRAGDPMWRGGLSGTRSLFMHSDRPLISGNRTSSVIHELVHVGTGISGDRHSDWIVEGIAEFYAVEILRRTGAISQRRFEDSLERLAEWGRKSGDLFTDRSSGPTTARAVGVFHQLDQEIRQATGNRASIDEVARALAAQRGTVTLDGFVTLAEQVAGRPLATLAFVRDWQAAQGQQHEQRTDDD